MKLKVLRYDSDLNYHMCEDEDGIRHRVDLLVNGDLPKETTHEYLIGKIVEVDELIPYLVLAREVKIVGSTLSEANKIEEAANDQS